MNAKPHASLLSDQALWVLVCEGQERAFTQIIQRYATQLVGYGRKWTPDDELIKDCIQDVYAELWLQRHRHVAIESLKAYLLASVRYRIGKQLQRAQRFVQPVQEGGETTFTITFSVEEEWIADEEQRLRVQRLNAFINRLPARQQEIIYLKYHQNLNHTQIAQVMAINYQSVSNLLQRTLAALRDECSPELLMWLGVAMQLVG